MNNTIGIFINNVPGEIYIAVIIGLLLIFSILLSSERDKTRQARKQLELLESTFATIKDEETASVQTVEVNSGVTLGITENCRLLLALTNEMTGAADGFLLSGTDDPAEYAFYRDLLGDDSLRGLTKDDKDFFALPGSLKNYEAELVLIVKIPALYYKGVAVFWYKELPQQEYYRFTGLQLMMKKMADLWDGYGLACEQSVSILEMLKSLLQIMDSQKPHTVGFSDLMARYAGIIAREMKLDKETTEDVILAAELSNLSLLGASVSFGADAAGALLDNPRAANFIRHQQEKIDGSGQPAGLQGTQIPVGARILAVVREFLEKITGAPDQEPLSYEKTMEYLQAQAGVSLDQVAVNALLRWFARKQESPEIEGRSLGKCREMRCVPRRLCENCPADTSEQNCWDVEGVLCAAHGNTCASCFVYTEYLARMGPKFGV